MPEWRDEIRQRLASLKLEPTRESEIVEELTQHLDDRYQELLAGGATDEEARRTALTELSGSALLEQELRRTERAIKHEPVILGMRRSNILEAILQDLRYGLRTMRRSPGFTLVAVLTLALGIGANTAIFSVVNGVLLKPLSYREPERLVTLLHRGTNPVAPADFLDWRQDSQSFEAMAAAESWGGTLTGSDRPDALSGIRFSEGMFQLLGVQPLVGRTFQADDFKAGNDRVLVLGHALWQRRFGGDPKIVGQSVTFNGEAYTIIGVMPPEFRFAPFWATKAELAAPMDLTSRATSRNGSSLRIFARLKSGVSREQAQAEMDAICRRLEQAYPQTNTGRTVKVDPLIEKVVGNIKPALLMLAGAVIFVLLIACANVANLLLVRAAARQKEMAIRTALGASRLRTIRQLLTESVLLSMLAGGLGLLLGYASVAWIKGLLAGDFISSRMRMPRVSEITMDSTTLIFTLGIAVLTGLIFGLAPAWQAARADLNETMKESGRSATAGRRGNRLRSALVVAEIALAMITLVGAGLMLRSFTHVMAVNPGFAPQNVLSMDISLRGQPEMIGERREAFYQQLIERVQALPGVESASAINHLPLAGDTWGFPVSIEGHPLPPPGQGLSATYRVVRPAYFQTMKVRLLRGRDFNRQDAANAPGVAIINEEFARQHWPNENPIGKRVTFDQPNHNPDWRTIVGVVANVKQQSWTDHPGIEIYVPFPQSGFASNPAGHYSAMTLVVRAAANPLNLASAVQDTVWNLNRSAPVSSVTTLEQVIANAVWQSRFNFILIGLFAGLALLLGAVGIYGVMAYVVAARTHEIGIRLALGAQRQDVLKLIIGQGMKLVLIGLLIGIAGALALTRLMTDLLYQIQPTDPLTFAGVGALLASVACLACWLPARRATKVDPMVALRYE